MKTEWFDLEGRNARARPSRRTVLFSLFTEQSQNVCVLYSARCQWKRYATTTQRCIRNAYTKQYKMSIHCEACVFCFKAAVVEWGAVVVSYRVHKIFHPYAYTRDAHMFLIYNFSIMCVSNTNDAHTIKGTYPETKNVCGVCTGLRLKWKMRIWTHIELACICGYWYERKMFSERVYQPITRVFFDFILKV